MTCTCPGALSYIGGALDPHNAEVRFGNCTHLVDDGTRVRGSDVARMHREMNLALADYIIQPSAFWTLDSKGMDADRFAR